MSRIILIGGASFSKKNSYEIDQEIISITGKKNPNVLYIPIGSRNNRERIRFFTEYWTWLGCKVTTFDGINGDIEKLFIENDIIYFGGGDSLHLMKNIRKIGIDKLVNKYKKGKVYVGNSAGAMVFGKYGNASYRKNGDIIYKTRRVTGMNILNISICPHFTNNPHKEITTKAMMARTPGVGVGLDDGVALEVVNDNYRIIRAIDGGKAYKLFFKEGEYYKEEIKSGEELRSISELETKK